MAAHTSRRRRRDSSPDSRVLISRRSIFKDAAQKARKRRKTGPEAAPLAHCPVRIYPETSQPPTASPGRQEDSEDVEMVDRPLVIDASGQRHWQRTLSCGRGGIRPNQLGGGDGGSSGSGGTGGKLSIKQGKAPAKASSSAKPVRAKNSPSSKAPVPADDSAFNSEEVNDLPFLDAVVKVFCIHTEPNFSLPWQRKRQFSTNSSGFIISGNRVLTNAHSVEHYTQVKVKKRGSDIKFVATVLAIGTECDIAMLAVEDNEFWRGVTPVDFGALPRLQDSISVVGYPIGGDTISVTSGVVSRIEITSYVHGSSELLGVQIDAAINAGNSGGPSFNDRGECIGIAFQSLKHEDCENIGYVIPTPVISHFIMDYEQHGHYTGFPVLGIEWQRMENPDLRRAVGMKANQKGVRIRRVEPTAPAAMHLRTSDILLSFDGINIANDGTVPFRSGERIGFTYLVSQKYTGQRARIRVLRGGQIMEHSVEVSIPKRLVPAHNKGMLPSYYIVAGLVFAPVSVPYLRSELLLQYGKEYDYDAPVKLLDKLMHNFAQTDDEQLVVISQVLAAEINIGYEDIVNTQILAFNGTPVRNLKHLASMVEVCDDGFLRFDLEYQQMIVLDTRTAKNATPEILRLHCIPSAMSDDLRS